MYFRLEARNWRQIRFCLNVDSQWLRKQKNRLYCCFVAYHTKSADTLHCPTRVGCRMTVSWRKLAKQLNRKCSCDYLSHVVRVYQGIIPKLIEYRKVVGIWESYLICRFEHQSIILCEFLMARFWISDHWQQVIRLFVQCTYQWLKYTSKL